MKLSSILNRYTSEQLSAAAAQRLAQEIAFAPFVFQVSRLMVKFGIFDALCRQNKGMTLEEISQQTNLSKYATQVLLEASLSIGTVILKENKFFITKAGWFLEKDKMTRINMEFTNEVCYQGLFHLEQALQNEKPEGLKVFGDWPTIYEGLSQLPKVAQEKWFAFDHYYSDNSFADALQIIFSKPIRNLLDVGGNTGRFALQCIEYNPEVEVTIMDLPQQLTLMQNATKGKQGAERIHGYGANLLDKSTPFPKGFDVIWMSQFLDCFSEEEVTSILTRAADAMEQSTELYILEAYWDRQTHETGAFCLNQISVYFTAMANGNSKMYYSEDMIRCVNNAGLKVSQIYDGLGTGNSHTIFRCTK